MVDIEKLFTRINEQVDNTFSFFSHEYEDTVDWINNYGEELRAKIKATETNKYKFPIIIKSPLGRRKYKPNIDKSHCIVKKTENSEYVQKFKRIASRVAEQKISFQSICNLKTKLRRQNNDDSVLYINNNTNIKIEEEIQENLKNQIKYNQKENLSLSVIKHKNIRENNQDNLVLSDEEIFESSANSSIIIFQENPIPLIEHTDLENEEFKTPILQKYLSENLYENECIDMSLPVINHKNKRKKYQKGKELSEKQNEIKCQETNNYDSDIEETKERIVTEVINNSKIKLNLLSSTKESLEASNCTVNLKNKMHEMNIFSKGCERNKQINSSIRTPLKPIFQTNNSNISNLELLQKINKVCPNVLSYKCDRCDSIDSMGSINKTFIIEDDRKKSTKPLILSTISNKILLSDSSNNINKIKNTMKTFKTSAYLQEEEKQKKLLEKEEEAKKKRKALIQIKIEAQNVRKEKKKEIEKKQLIIQLKQDEHKEVIEKQKKKNPEVVRKAKIQKNTNIKKIPFLPTGDCYDSDDPDGKTLKTYYVKPVWAEYENVTSLKMCQNHLPTNCIKNFFRMPLIKPNLLSLFKNARI